MEALRFRFRPSAAGGEEDGRQQHDSLPGSHPGRHPAGLAIQMSPASTTSWMAMVCQS